MASWRSIFRARDFLAASVFRARFEATGSAVSYVIGGRGLSRRRELTPETDECLLESRPLVMFGEPPGEEDVRIIGEVGSPDLAIEATTVLTSSRGSENPSLGKRDSHRSAPGPNSWSVAITGEVSWLNSAGDSNDGVLRSVKEVDGGAEVSLNKSVGETVPKGTGESLTAVKLVRGISLGGNMTRSAVDSKSSIN